MVTDKSPAFQWYPKQYLGDNKVCAMDWDARGMHHWLLNLSWQEDPRGTIPNDTAVIRRWLGSPSDEIWRRVWPQIMTAWFVQDGRLVNAGMVRAAQKQRNYSSGNKGKEVYANGTQITRKNIEVEDSSLDQAFELIWKKYPKKAGKEFARKCFPRAVQKLCDGQSGDKLQVEAAVELIGISVEKYAECKQGADPQFVLHFSTFLNQARYLDDPAAWRTGGTTQINRAEERQQGNAKAAFGALAILGFPVADDGESDCQSLPFESHRQRPGALRQDPRDVQG